MTVGDDINLCFLPDDIAVHQNRRPVRDIFRIAHILSEVGWIVDDLHRPPAQNVGRPDEHWIADLLRHEHRRIGRRDCPACGLGNVQLSEQQIKAVPVFRQIDAVERRPENRDTCLHQWLSQINRRLSAELYDHTFDRCLTFNDMQDIFGRQRLKIQPVGRIEIGRHRLRVIVDDDRFVSCFAQGTDAVDAGIIEFDSLPDTDWAAAQHDDFFLRGG